MEEPSELRAQDGGPVFGTVKAIIWTLASRLSALRFFAAISRVSFFPFQKI